ncbi:MAG TPA: hypothetical protein VIY08_03155 [Candidatus Nitrosocosmicus sp.]
MGTHDSNIHNNMNSPSGMRRGMSLGGHNNFVDCFKGSYNHGHYF